jgi:hypothetical protein
VDATIEARGASKSNVRPARTPVFRSAEARRMLRA